MEEVVIGEKFDIPVPIGTVKLESHIHQGQHNQIQVRNFGIIGILRVKSSKLTVLNGNSLAD